MIRFRTIFLCLAGCSVALFEATAITLLPSPWNAIHPLVNMIIIFLLIGRPQLAFLLALFGGICLDLFSLQGTSLFMLRLLIVTALLYTIGRTTLTNRSWYAALALVVAARSVDGLLSLAIHFIGRSFQWDVVPLTFGVWARTLGWDLAFMSIFFFGITLFTKRFSVTISRESSVYGTR